MIARSSRRSRRRVDLPDAAAVLVTAAGAPVALLSPCSSRAAGSPALAWPLALVLLTGVRCAARRRRRRREVQLPAARPRSAQPRDCTVAWRSIAGRAHARGRARASTAGRDSGRRAARVPLDSGRGAVLLDRSTMRAPRDCAVRAAVGALARAARPGLEAAPRALGARSPVLPDIQPRCTTRARASSQRDALDGLMAQMHARRGHRVRRAGRLPHRHGPARDRLEASGPPQEAAAPANIAPSATTRSSSRSIPAG